MNPWNRHEFFREISHFFSLLVKVHRIIRTAWPSSYKNWCRPNIREGSVETGLGCAVTMSHSTRVRDTSCHVTYLSPVQNMALLVYSLPTSLVWVTGFKTGHTLNCNVKVSYAHSDVDCSILTQAELRPHLDSRRPVLTAQSRFVQLQLSMYYACVDPWSW
jgi:hypothetical protein